VIHQLWHGFKRGTHGSNPWKGGFFSVGASKQGLLKRAGGALHTGYEMSFKGNMIFAAPMAALSFGMAGRGQKVEAAAGSAAAGIGSFIGGAVFGLPGALAGGFLADEFFSSRVGKAVGRLKDVARNQHHVNFSSGFEDSENAFTMRQRAVQEMSGSLMNARQYIGNEGSFMHS
jgi:hypothetical protein